MQRREPITKDTKQVNVQVSETLSDPWCVKWSVWVFQLCDIGGLSYYFCLVVLCCDPPTAPILALEAL